MPKSSLSPTQRTLKWLRADGWHCQIVEHWNAFARRRIDLFGGIDIVCLKENTTLGVQCTSTANMAARKTKMKELPGITAWLNAGNELWIVGWGKRGARGKRKLWTHKVDVITAKELAA